MGKKEIREELDKEIMVNWRKPSDPTGTLLHLAPVIQLQELKLNRRHFVQYTRKIILGGKIWQTGLANHEGAET